MAFPKKNLFTTLCKVISLIVFLSLALPRLAISQGIGINNTTPDASAILDLAATDRGLLVPRMTQNQKNAISSPATGLLIFQTDAPMGYYFYDSSAWIKLTSSSEATWTKSGNFVYNSSDSIGIGTATPSSKLYIDGGDIKIAQIATEDPYIIRSYSNSSSLWFMPANAAKTPKLVLADAHQWDRSVEIDYDAGTTGAGAGILRIGQISKNGTDFTHGITALYTKGTERIRITNDGNVGLGTSTPGTKFSILGAVSIDKKNETDTARLYFQRYANGGLNNKVGALIDWNNAGHLRFFTTHSQSSSGSEYGYFQFYMPDHSSSEFTINKWTAGNALGIAAGSSALFKVGNDGNVGIGTSSPSAKLEVNGQIKITGGSPGANKVLTSDADGLATWEAVPGAEDRQDSNISIAGWYRIAECTGGGKRANATFVLTDKISGGGHSTVTFKMGVSYNQIANSHFVLLSHSYYSTKTFTKIRLLTNTTYDEMYLEVYANRTGNVYSAIYHNHNTDGWNSVDWSAGSIPTGYTATEHSLEAQFAVGNNTESFFVSNDGNVGIGNTNPTARLEITEDGTNPGIILNYGGSNTFASVQGPSNRDLRFDLDGSGASDKFHFRNIGSYGTNSDLMVIRADTTVGIGTTSPTAGLDVFQKAIRARRDNDQYVEMVSNTASGSYLRGHSRETNQKPLYIENVYNTNGTGAGTLDIRFRIGNESSSTTVMTLEDDYQVGIGTIDPTELLHVAGNMRLTGTIKDVNNEGGTNGQVLTATGTGLDWLDASSLNDGDWTSNSPDIYNANTGGVAIGTSTNSQTLTGDLWADQSAITKLNIVIPSSNTTVDVGIHNELSSTTNTTNSLFAYGIYNKNSIASNNIAVGIYNKADSTSTGSRIGLLNYAYGKATTSNVVYGIYNTTNSRGSGDTYGIYSSNVSLGTGNNYNFYAYGNATNYFQGNVGVGVGTKSSTEKLAVAGAVELLTTTAPNSTTNKLYNTSGNLFWNGTQLNNSSSNEFIDGGNSFGAIATLGTNDGYGLAIETNGTERMTINSSGKVGIGALTPSANLHVKSSSAGEIFKLESTESGTQSGPDVNLYRNSSSPADDDFLGRFVYKGENSIGDIIEYGQIKAQIGDVTSTDEGFNMFFQGMVNGTNRSFLGLRANDGGGIADQAEVTINENSIDMDFRIESDVNTHAFFVRGSDSKVGIGESSPLHILHIDAGSSSGIARLESNATTYTAWMIANNGGGKALSYYDAIDGNFSGSDYGSVGQTDAGYMEYSIGTSSPKPYHIFTGGNVGIGTGNIVTEKLEVAGNIRVNNNASILADGNGVLYVGTTSANVKFGGDGSWSFIEGNSNHLSLQTSRDGDDVVFKGGDAITEYMRIESGTGNVGIGTNDPDELLHIDGNVLIEEKLKYRYGTPSSQSITTTGKVEKLVRFSNSTKELYEDDYVIIRHESSAYKIKAKTNAMAGAWGSSRIPWKDNEGSPNYVYTWTGGSYGGNNNGQVTVTTTGFNKITIADEFYNSSANAANIWIFAKEDNTSPVYRITSQALTGSSSYNRYAIIEVYYD